MNDTKKVKVFFFANIPVNNVKPSYGGATVLAKEILIYLKQDKRLVVKHMPIRNTWKPKFHVFDHVLWIFKFPFYIKSFDVISFHTTWDFNFTTAPLIWLWAKILRKKTVYHFFGGNFHLQYDKIPSFLKWIYNKTILNSDKVFFETKAMMNYFEEVGLKNSEWLPNARKPVIEELGEKKFNKKFVFISRVIPEKGINEIVEAAEKIPQDYTIDIFGPIDNRYLNDNFFEDKKARYKGVLNPEDVSEVLNQYDVMLLPSWFKGEGYPGIIIEALSLGIPVISTYWNSIPEIIEDGFNGKLIEIKNAEKLCEAILSFNSENLNLYRQNAFDSFVNFNSEIVFEKLIKAYFDE